MRTNCRIPKVSVCIIAYNQEEYIYQCLTSILNQKTNFEFDLVIGEDCSTDGTTKIIEELAHNNGNILLLNNNENLGVLPNFIRTLKACEGEYIAFCEGDDYWIDEFKLQKQVDFLENNSSYGGCCGEIISYNVEKEVEIKHTLKKEGRITFDDIIYQNKIHSNTILFRNKLLNFQSLSTIRSLAIGDWYVHLIVTQKQPYYYMPYYFTLYRMHNDGVFSKKSNFFKSFNKVKLLENFLKNQVRREFKISTLESLKKHIYNAMKESGVENKNELKELFLILIQQKVFKLNRSVYRAALNLIK